MKMVIISPKYGSHTVLFDDEDLDLIKKYRWSIWRSYNGKFYAFHSWKREGKEVSIKMHRLIMGVQDNRTPLVDHRDGDTLNNKKENLRMAAHSQNSMNRGKTSKNNCGYKGVSKKTPNRYQAAITVNGKRYYGGLFEDPIDAAKKYDEMALKYHGEFAYFNFPLPTTISKCDKDDLVYVQPTCDRKRKNTTGFRGVYFNGGSKVNPFFACLEVDGERVRLGVFSDAISAAKEYDKAAKKHFGIRASLNFHDEL
jgi:hypothetical protein